MDQPAQRIIEANNIRINVAEQGSGPLVLLRHGFPKCWYSWRQQIPALAEAGFHAVAPDMRGYGKSDRPVAIDQYTIFHLVGDLVSVLDALDAKSAVVVGHDVGASGRSRSARWKLTARCSSSSAVFRLSGTWQSWSQRIARVETWKSTEVGIAGADWPDLMLPHEHARARGRAAATAVPCQPSHSHRIFQGLMRSVSHAVATAASCRGDSSNPTICIGSVHLLAQG